MMSDDAVVVLVTKNPSDDEVSDYEYRVSYTDNLEKLYGIFDPDTGKWAGDNGIILDLFSEKTVYTDLDVAVDTAQDLIAEMKEPEFGIMIMRDFQTKYFHEL